MGISYRTQTFHDIKHKLANLEGDDVNPEKVESIIESFGVDVDKYFDESEVYYKNMIEEKSIHQRDLALLL